MISEEQLGAAVRELRKAAGLSQRELAENSGIAKQAITNIERVATVPTLRTLERLAITLRVPPSEVLGRAEGQTQPSDGSLDGQHRDLWNSLDPDTRSLAMGLLRTIANWSSKAKRRKPARCHLCMGPVVYWMEPNLVLRSSLRGLRALTVRHRGDSSSSGFA